jgi:AcrR family transcriptional regulator
MRHDPAQTRRRIIDAGLDLFYSASIADVGVDQIAATAGVTKKTLYYHFPSKDVLVTACYEARADATLGRYRAWAGSDGSAVERLERVFAGVRGYVDSPRFFGCGFMRAASELASKQDHPACGVIARYKHAFEAWLAEMLAADGYADPARLARQVIVLLDGCLAHVMFHRDPSYAEDAARAARRLLDGAERVPAH